MGNPVCVKCIISDFVLELEYTGREEDIYDYGRQSSCSELSLSSLGRNSSLPPNGDRREGNYNNNNNNNIEDKKYNNDNNINNDNNDNNNNNNDNNYNSDNDNHNNNYDNDNNNNSNNIVERVQPSRACL